MNTIDIKGFNYQPSYGSSGFELWQIFDAKTIEIELARGKEYFPHINALRWWLSWDSWKRDARRFERNFEVVLQLAENIGCRVMPVLFNRWHDAVLDYGGIYADHFLPGASWVQREKMFEPFLHSVVGNHRDDARIFCWDLCNEPFAYLCAPDEIPDIAQAEYSWLESIYTQCKTLGATAPLTIGAHMGEGLSGLKRVDKLCDWLSIHPYCIDMGEAGRAQFIEYLDVTTAFAHQSGKPLLATETCWGSLNDAARVDMIRFTLAELQKRGIGWLAYALQHSAVADLHREEFGPVSVPGNLSFIEKNGSLRPGHDCFNAF